MKTGFITDLHVGHEDLDEQETLDTMENIVSQLEDECVEHTICLGDLVHEGVNEWVVDQVIQILQNGDFEMWFTPGNHDANEYSLAKWQKMVGNNLNEYVRDLDLMLVDTGFPSDKKNLGHICGYGLEMLERKDPKYVASHFPMVYTDAYQQSPWFGEDPQAVFPMNKHRYDPEDRNHFFGHLHLGHQWDGNEILGPVTEISGPDANRAEITETYHVRDL